MTTTHTVVTAFTLTPNDGTVDGTANTITQITATSVARNANVQNTPALTTTTFSDTGNQMGQSFTAPRTGTLASINIASSVASTGATLKIYSGEGIAGTLLHTQTIPVLNNTVVNAAVVQSYGYQAVALDRVVQLTSGQVYTLDITATGYFPVYDGNSYAGGMQYNAGTGVPAYDNFFQAVINGANTAPTMNGTFATNVNKADTATTLLFASVFLADNEGDMLSVNITYPATTGTLSGTGLSGTAGNYTVDSAPIATAQSNLQNVLFTPAINQVATGSTTTATFTLTPNDSTINGTPDSTTRLTIQSVNANPTGALTITGTPTQRQQLTADMSAVADLDGLPATFSYQWFLFNVSIAQSTQVLGTAATFTPTLQSLVGQIIFVKVTYTDLGGTVQTLNSASVRIVNANDAPTGSVTIAGTATQKQTLTASNNLADADGMTTSTVVYTWKRGATTLATGSTYTLAQADVGTTITVTGSYTDDLGAAESVTSIATAAVVNVNDAPTGSVSITGTATQNQTLTAGNTLADIDGMVNATVSYQWSRAGVAIAGATASTYALVQADVAKTITVTGSYTDDLGAAESVTSTATVAVVNVNSLPTGSVTITGTTTQNQVLTAANTLADGMVNATMIYQWSRAGVAITGATASTYTLVQADVGQTITVTASYTDDQGTAESMISAATTVVINVNDAPTGSVTISGTVTQNQTLTAGNTLADIDGMVNATVIYQWSRAGVAITGATASTYTLVQADVAKTITVTGSYTDDLGAAESVSSTATVAVVNVNDLPTGAVTITGTVTQNQTLTAANTLADIDGMVNATVIYQWSRAGVAIAGATASTYALVQADVGKTITVTGSYTDDLGAAEAVTSTATVAVVNVNDLPTGSVTITGAATQNQTLTAGDTLADIDGMATSIVSYSWTRLDVRNPLSILKNISTTSRYTLVQADVGNTVTVTAFYMDDLGTVESVSSTATAAVANVNDAPTGSVNITGTATENQTLTAGNTLADIDGMVNATVIYQWSRAGVAIAGATASTYALVQADVGQTITVTGSYTDDQGTAESMISAATTVVINVNDAPTGSVTITGTATIGQTLIASNTLADIDGLGTITYNWLRNGNPTGITGSTYTLQAIDGNNSIKVVATYTDLQGTAETVSSAATAAVPPLNPVISSATYDGLTNTLVVTGLEMFATAGASNDIDVTKLTLLGQGGISYTLTSPAVELDSATQFTVILNAADRINVEGLLNKNGLSAIDATVFNIAAAANWNPANAGFADLTANAVTMSNVQLPTITSATYDAATGNLAVTGTGFVQIAGANNDINLFADPAVFLGFHMTLMIDSSNSAVIKNTANVDITSETQFSITLHTTDQALANMYMNKNGTMSTAGTAFNLATLDGWNSVLSKGNGIFNSVITPITVSNVAVPTITSATYNAGLGKLVVTGNNLLARSRRFNDILANKFTFTGQAGASYTLLNSANVELPTTPPYGTSFTLTLDSADKAAVNALLDKNGTAASGGTVYNLAAAEDWANGADVAVVVADLTGNGITVSNVNTLPTGNVTITGTTTQGQLLTAANTLADADGIVSAITYQWKRPGINLATGATYTLAPADAGKQITVTASYTDGLGYTEYVSAATANIVNINDAPTGSVTITGTATQNQTLTASNTLADADGLGLISYTWKRGTVTINTGATYTLVQADVGNTVTVTAAYIDGFNTAESVSSIATAAVTNVNDLPTGSVTITGSVTQNQILTASNNLADADGLGTITYQWKRAGVAIAG